MLKACNKRAQIDSHQAPTLSLYLPSSKSLIHMQEKEQKFIQKNVPSERVDEVLGLLNDVVFKSHSPHLESSTY